MDVDQFWRVIEGACRDSDDDPDAKEEALRTALEALPADEVASFAEHFDTFDAQAYRWDLWGAAYVLRGGCSDDAFMDFRASLICRGREVYERALADPDSLADVALLDPEEDLFFEGYGYLAPEIYEAKAGGDLPDRKTPFPAEPVGDPWDEDDDDLAKRYPRLAAKYG